VVAAVMFPFRGTDYGTTASLAKTRVRHQSKGTHGAEHAPAVAVAVSTKQNERHQDIRAVEEKTCAVSAYS
jgi:hypothetical protein